MSVWPGAARPRRFGWLDAAILVLIGCVLAYVVLRISTVLNYRWNWAPIPQYLFRWDEQRGLVANLMVQGLLTTLRLALWASVLAAVVGGLAGICLVARPKLARLAGRGFVEVLRNTPPLVLVFVGYFFISSQLVPMLGLDRIAQSAPGPVLATLGLLFGDPRLLPNFASALVVLALLESAYVAEILRGGLQSIEAGQHDAASALGLSRWQAMRRVILPQAVARMVPPLCNQFISLIKDSSIVSLVSIQDLTFMSNDVAVSTGRVFETWITASALYFLLCFGLSLLFAGWERRLARS